MCGTIYGRGGNGPPPRVPFLAAGHLRMCGTIYGRGGNGPPPRVPFLAAGHQHRSGANRRLKMRSFQGLRQPRTWFRFQGLGFRV
jgi:hypothetical protein